MNNLTPFNELPTLQIGEQTYLSERLVLDCAAANLFPDQPLDSLSEVDYQHLRQTAERHCQSLGYTRLLKLTPPQVYLAQMGFYWTKTISPNEPMPTPAQTNSNRTVLTEAEKNPGAEADETEPFVIMIGPGLGELLSEGQLQDARLGPLGVDDVTRQHYTIPVLADGAVVGLMDKAVNSNWPNDYKGIWHDILSQSKRGQEISRTEREFTVIIRGVGQKQYWPMRLHLKHDPVGDPYLQISLVEVSPKPSPLSDLGQVVMTDGAAALRVNFRPYIARHQSGDWGTLDAYDQRQNRQAVKRGLRILSAYDVSVEGGETETIWIITEGDRSVTTILLPEEY